MPWKKDDEVVTTFGSLKQAQNEAFQEGIAYAVSILKREEQDRVAEILELATAGVKLYSEGDEK